MLWLHHAGPSNTSLEKLISENQKCIPTSALSCTGVKLCKGLYVHGESVCNFSFNMRLVSFYKVAASGRRGPYLHISYHSVLFATSSWSVSVLSKTFALPLYFDAFSEKKVAVISIQDTAPLYVPAAHSSHLIPWAPQQNHVVLQTSILFIIVPAGQQKTPKSSRTYCIIHGSSTAHSYVFQRGLAPLLTWHYPQF